MTTRQTLIALSLIVFALPLQARVIYYGPGEEVVPITAGDKTLFKFSKEVRTIARASKFRIEPANPEAPNYSFLSVSPKMPMGSSNVLFVLSNQTTVRLKLVVSPKGAGDTDSIYEFKPRSSLSDSVTSIADSNTPQISGIELIKALIREDEISGYQIREPSIELEESFKNVSVKLVKKYIGGEFTGYIFRIQNLSHRNKIFIDIKHLTLGDPNLAIMSNVDHPILDPKHRETNQALLRIVAKNVSDFHKLILPTEIMEKAVTK